ncbi:hypothetical protein GGP41_009424 [Bipolaris sorokiniana]|uniref:Uncharacterized protein n=1 Tax=Cochliobolus sativus TaxID=45130 RepID=A0A8H5ZBN7_COCSA|nr:hypothetical protein GGP41_009424 [Bipolaris sorokiniana]
MGIEHLAVGFHEASLHSAAPCPGLRDAVHGLATGCPFQWVHTYLLLSSVYTSILSNHYTQPRETQRRLYSIERTRLPPHGLTHPAACPLCIADPFPRNLCAGQRPFSSAHDTVVHSTTVVSLSPLLFPFSLSLYLSLWCGQHDPRPHATPRNIVVQRAKTCV